MLLLFLVVRGFDRRRCFTSIPVNPLRPDESSIPNPSATTRQSDEINLKKGKVGSKIIAFIYKIVDVII